MLKTPEKIREFQKKLYLKAKQEKRFRFYQLYDKIWRKDILEHAWKLVKANNGRPGVDGVSIIQIKEQGETNFLDELQKGLKEKRYQPQPIMRVYIPKPNGKERPLGIPTVRDRVVQMAMKIVIEPIFEADFEENSYGFRPKRNAHQSMDEIRKYAYFGYTQIIDADLTSYFDTIPHDKLMLKIAERIVDRWVLKLIKQWLKTPVIENGKTTSGKGNKKGTPQGGVISPLLSNIYLTQMDKEINKMNKGIVKLVRYADDFVVMVRSKQSIESIRRKVKDILAKMGLTVNDRKARILNLEKKEQLNFLGFTVKKENSYSGGKRKIVAITPSKEAGKRLLEKVRIILNRKNKSPMTEVIGKLNRVIRGWSNYFWYANSSDMFCSLNHYINQRIRIFMCRRRGIQGYGFKRISNYTIYDKIGLYLMPRTAPYNAVGRNLSL